MRQIILFESFKQKHKALLLFAHPVTPLYLGYLQTKDKMQFPCSHKGLKTTKCLELQLAEFNDDVPMLFIPSDFSSPTVSLVQKKGTN
jgi:hypothetical protein